MASLMEELIQTLDAEEKCYSQLIPIEEEKTRAIIANDLEALQDITVREHDLVDETSALENKRERVAIDIATVLGRDPKTITLEQIASVLKNQPADQKKLQEVHDRLRRTVSRLQELNNQNKQLLKEAISGEKVVLIENEFGEIGIDGGFLKDAGINITEMRPRWRVWHLSMGCLMQNNNRRMDAIATACFVFEDGCTFFYKEWR